MTAIPYELRLLMIEVGAATSFYPNEPLFRGGHSEAQSSGEPSDTVAA